MKNAGLDEIVNFKPRANINKYILIDYILQKYF